MDKTRMRSHVCKAKAGSVLLWPRRPSAAAPRPTIPEHSHNNMTLVQQLAKTGGRGATDLLGGLGRVASQAVLLEQSQEPGSEAEDGDGNALGTPGDGACVLATQLLDQLGKLRAQLWAQVAVRRVLDAHPSNLPRTCKGQPQLTFVVTLGVQA